MFRHVRLPLLGACLAILVLAGPAQAFDDTAVLDSTYTRKVRTLTPRPGVTIRYVSHQYKTLSKASVQRAAILLPGGNGKLGLTASGQLTGLNQNFLMRTRERFLLEGIALVAAVDVPSDSLPNGLDGNIRLGANYAIDIGKVIADVKAQSGLKSWLIGTSASPTGVANVAARLTTANLQSIVLTSSITQLVTGQCGRTVFNANLAAIDLPSLVVAHRDDACPCTPASKSAQVIAALTGTTDKAKRIFTGGLPPISTACEAQSQHGYYGIETQVVRYIVDWIDARTP